MWRGPIIIKRPDFFFKSSSTAMPSLAKLEDRPTPSEVYNWKIYAYSICAAFGAVLYGYDVRRVQLLSSTEDSDAPFVERFHRRYHCAELVPKRVWDHGRKQGRHFCEYRFVDRG